MALFDDVNDSEWELSDRGSDGNGVWQNMAGPLDNQK
jgi:hypothetical protein